MKRILLLRKTTSDQGTFGSIHLENLTLFSGELPWLDNRPNVSCIPTGVYQCVYTPSARFKRRLYAVTSVQGRAGVRFHSANLMGNTTLGYKAQLNGCIALGEKLGTIEGQRAILLSASAMRKFETALNYEPFELEVIEEYV